MNSLVVLFAVVGAVCGGLVPAQPAHLPALVLDPHGRPLDTAEVINARALHLTAKALDHLDGHASLLAHAAPLAVAHAPLLAHAPVVAHALPAAVSHQSRVDVHTSHPIISHAPLVATHSVSAWPAYGHALGHGLGYGHGLGHLLKKRSLALAHVLPSAVSHQSRIDVINSHAAPVVSHAVAPIAVAHAVAPVAVAHALPAAVSHQSRVDVHTSHPVISHAVHAPLVAAHSVSAWPAYGHGLGHGLGYGHGLSHGLGHLLKKRSLALAHVLPSAVSHQSRVDVIESHSAPIAVAHSVAPIAIAHAAPVAVAHALPAAVSHQSRVDVHTSHPIVSSHIAPLAHSAVWSAPAAHWAHSPLTLASHW